MPLIETKGAASAQGFGEFLQQSAATYIEDVFSTWLYTGNSGTQTITNGIDLSTKGGLVWMKDRDSSTNTNILFDTARGATNYLVSSITNAQNSSGSSLTAFNSDGFSLGSLSTVNYTGDRFASWTFRKQPKFFDIVTYTGNGDVSRAISHNLGSVPGCVIVKRTDATGSWFVYHRNLTDVDYYLLLNTTAAQSGVDPPFGSPGPTATTFQVRNPSGSPSTSANISGATYVAYLFAHNAGGFGLSGTDNVISCGSVTADSSGNATVNLGYEPQWVLMKSSSGTNNWAIIDNMRGFQATGSIRFLYPNLNNAEAGGGLINLNSTGFYSSATLSANATYIYIAIRRGPMKVPTSGTQVFVTSAGSSFASDSTPNFGSTFCPDTCLVFEKSGTFGGPADFPSTFDRLRNNNVTQSNGIGFYYLTSNPSISPGYERTDLGSFYKFIQNNTSFGFRSTASSTTQTGYLLQRRPSFFDVVCYTGTGSARTVSHNLGVTPELMMVKNRSGGGAAATSNWAIYFSGLTATQSLFCPGGSNTSTGPSAAGSVSTFWNDTSPTSSVFTVGTASEVNGSGGTYVAYLFATLAGVSKVGSYTGTGALQTINCGFTGGARFVLIKRSNSTGGFFIYDSVNGISSGNDPYYLLNSGAGQQGGTNYIDTTSVGFQITAAAPAELNANGSTFYFLAIA